MLSAYLTQTEALLQNPASSTINLYTTADLTRYINIARGQMAGETGCIRAIGTIATVIAQQQYNFSSINVGVPATTGIQAPLHVRRLTFNSGTGQLFVPGFAWEWFDLYYLNNAAPTQGVPVAWAQYAQGAAPGATGSAATGSFFINQPDQVYTLNCDCACYPIPLAADGDVEAIPYLWTDAVPYFAAYYALLSAQTNARMNDALNYYKIYKEFIDRARTASNPSVNRWQFEGTQDPVQAAKLGVKGAA